MQIKVGIVPNRKFLV